MELMQRFGCQYNDKYVDGYIAQMVKYPGSCNNVWLPTSYNYPTLEEHRAYADFWKKTAEKLRAVGISVSLQLSNSLGHGDRPYGNCKGLLFEGSPVRLMVGHDGTQAITCFCPRGEFFKNYIATALSYYAELQPEQIWVDDDFRAKGHGRVKFGCFCEDCIAAFNAEHGTALTREQLVERVLYGELSWREKWIAFTRESLKMLVRDIAAKVHEVSPNTVFSYQHGSYGAYTGYSLDFVYDAMKEANGGVAPCSRPGGGAYNDRDPNRFIEKAIAISYQNSMLPAYVKRKAPEIESLPFHVFGKSPAGTAFETSLYFAYGNTDMSYSMLMHDNEPMEWYGKIFKLFSEQRAYWDRLADGNLSTRQAGIRYFMPEGIWRKKLAEGEGFAELNDEPYKELNDCSRDAIPFVYDKKEESVFFLHPEVAKHISAEELSYLRTRPVITDGESIDILQHRGFDFGIECTLLEEMTRNMLREGFCDHELCRGTKDVYQNSIYGRGRMTAYTMRMPQEAEIISAYVPALESYPAFFEGETYPFGVAEAIITLETGAKWAINGYCPWRGNIPTYKRDLLLNIADYISGNALPARLITPFPAILLPRKNEAGKVTCVSLVNCTVGESGEMELLVRNPAGDSFTFMSQYNGTTKLPARKVGEDYIVTVPSVNAWSVGTVFAE